YRAVQKDVALLALHTNLDCAPSAADMLLAPVGLEYTDPLRPQGTGSLGQLARPAEGRAFVALEELADAYQQAFGAVAKIWGDPAKPIFTVAVCSGGAGEVVPDVVRAGVDCFVTGELRHHEAVWLADENIALIELGHDVSELPYRFELQKALVTAGFPPGDIMILEPSASWWQPLIARRSNALYQPAEPPAVPLTASSTEPPTAPPTEPPRSEIPYRPASGTERENNDE
ncbi:MAG: Nif3-like dinuclear metal center hexameric protein, partial [Coriobacteriales bacterium]|nr:Nif3-like dinuclear metal center hexameric protein [Coriobacteriales bacterium]